MSFRDDASGFVASARKHRIVDAEARAIITGEGWTGEGKTCSFTCKDEAMARRVQSELARLAPGMVQPVHGSEIQVKATVLNAARGTIGREAGAPQPAVR